MRRTVVLLGLWACALTAGAAEPVQTADAAAEDPELTALLAVLQEETAVATKTRMNSDFVPGLVTVLHGDEMLALGAETVWDALALVPGLYTVRDRSGTPSVIVRGTDFPFNSGNVKVLVNGVALSRENAGINGIVLQLPLQQVERIEVIRGPGSVVYGDFAFMGLVNVITRQKGTHVFARYGGDRALAAGGDVAARVSGWDVGASAAGWTDDHAAFASPNVGDEDRRWGAAFMRRGGFGLSAQGITRDWSSAAPGQTATPAKQDHWAVDARYGRDLARGVRLELRGSYKDNLFSTGNNRFDGDEAEGGVDLHWSRGRHDALAGVTYVQGHIVEAIQRVPPPAGQTMGLVRSINDKDRRIASATVQDRFDVSDSFSITAGVRFDDYSDLDRRRLTPRASLVWRASERHILKLQYAEGFRGPAFFELYATGPDPNHDLGFEVNGTTELNYVYRRPHTVARATLFRAELRDMIFVGATPGAPFGNTRAGRAAGAELEWEQQLAERLKVTANLSWVDQQDDRNPQLTVRRSPAGARWLANAALLYRPVRRVMLSGHWNHVDRPSSTPEAKGYDVLDLGAGLHDVAIAGLQLRGGVKNALDAEVRYVSVRPDGTTDPFVFPGRTYWVQLAWGR
jgi:iron complex outermembrane receptor protein